MTTLRDRCGYFDREAQATGASLRPWARCGVHPDSKPQARSPRAWGSQKVAKPGCSDRPGDSETETRATAGVVCKAGSQEMAIPGRDKASKPTPPENSREATPCLFLKRDRWRYRPPKMGQAQAKDRILGPKGSLAQPAMGIHKAEGSGSATHLRQETFGEL